MSYQPTPRKAVLNERHEQIRRAMSARGIQVIVGAASSGYSGVCLRLRYAHDDRGNPAGYRVQLDDIRREAGKTIVRSTPHIEVREVTEFVAGQPNWGGKQGAYCAMPDVSGILAAAEQLLARPQFGEALTL